jgi:hypothetical protein
VRSQVKRQKWHDIMTSAHFPRVFIIGERGFGILPNYNFGQAIKVLFTSAFVDPLSHAGQVHLERIRIAVDKPSAGPSVQRSRSFTTFFESIPYPSDRQRSPAQRAPAIFAPGFRNMGVIEHRFQCERMCRHAFKVVVISGEDVIRQCSAAPYAIPIGIDNAEKSGFAVFVVVLYRLDYGGSRMTCSVSSQTATVAQS